MKKTTKSRKPSRHHVLLVSVFAIIIFLAVLAFVVQRNTYLENIAGEAIKQRITETKQLALTEDQIKVALAVQEGKKTEFFPCPEHLEPKSEQHWKLEAGWTWAVLLNRDAYCYNNRIACYYRRSNNELNTEEVITYKDLPGVENCQEATSGLLYGCDCELK